MTRLEFEHACNRVRAERLNLILEDPKFLEILFKLSHTVEYANGYDNLSGGISNPVPKFSEFTSYVSKEIERLQVKGEDTEFFSSCCLIAFTDLVELGLVDIKDYPQYPYYNPTEVAKINNKPKIKPCTPYMDEDFIPPCTQGGSNEM